MPASGLPVRWAAGVRSSASTKDIAGLRGRLWDSHSTEWWSSVPIQVGRTPNSEPFTQTRPTISAQTPIQGKPQYAGIWLSEGTDAPLVSVP
ncbi:hypothetical protein MJG53_008526 [Ovis ammon polii x Ovis aries]|uniref:Uncharacterized protein n=1 Tax=Ovis ammon polii x Ovis aries TaxID=2918886 RepID=A0ACB9V0W1_9CETA|nr:hypothetical protein MJG53_008526 [Ovis ammon polii x Ovis aries]